MNLNDVFPDGLTGEGIFYALNEYNVPWKTAISSVALDLEYYGNVSGGKTISPLLRRLLVDGVIPQSAINKLANSLYSMNGLRWTKLWNTYELEYNPIQNYNMTEVMSDDDTVTTYGRTHSKTGTEVDDRTRTDDNKESVYGFNSNNASDSDESDRTINDDNTHTYNVSDTDTGSDRQSHSYELTRSGNIGVTTSQQMIESERALWMWRYFYDVVFPDIDKMLTISVYSDDIIPVTMSGGITPTGEISITLNGDYDVTEYASAAVNVPNTYTESDNGLVVYNGELVSQIGREITENGTYDTTLNNALSVSVPNTYTAADEGKVVDNGALVAQSSQSITENGTYDTTLISELIANISGGGGGSTNILSGTDAPTASVGINGDVYLQYGGEAEKQSLSGFSIKKESSMSVSVSENEVEFVYGSGGSIGAQAYKQVDLTNVNVITVTMASGSHSYNNYQTEKFAPILFIENNVNPASSFVCDNAQAKRYICIGEDNKTVTKTINVSQFTGNYWIVFSSAGCDSTVTDLTFDGDYIFSAYCKVNGTWQNIIGTDIDDVNTGI